METADRVFWEHRAYPGAVVVPFLLVGGSAASGDERWPGLLLSGLLTRLNSVDWPRGSDADLDAFRTALPTGSWPADPDPLLSSALVDVLAQPVGADRRRQWLHDGRAHLDSRVDAVVGGQHRDCYRRVAEFAAAGAEAFTLAAGIAVGRAYLNGLHS